MIDTLAIIHRYYPEGSDIERVLRQHAEDVTGLALELVDAHPEMGLDREFVAEAAMLHDIGIYQTSAPEIFCTGEAPYILHGYLGAELLRSLGLPRHAWVAERHTGSGLTAEEIAARAIPLPPGIYTPQCPEEELICYADKFYSKTKLGQRRHWSAYVVDLASTGRPLWHASMPCTRSTAFSPRHLPIFSYFCTQAKTISNQYLYGYYSRLP